MEGDLYHTPGVYLGQNLHRIVISEKVYYILNGERLVDCLILALSTSSRRSTGWTAEEMWIGREWALTLWN
jgi:hypothetical protein